MAGSDGNPKVWRVLGGLLTSESRYWGKKHRPFLCPRKAIGPSWFPGSSQIPNPVYWCFLTQNQWTVFD